MSDVVLYTIRISEYVGQQAWDATVAELESRLPRLAGFIARHYQSGETFDLPRSFEREQALRLAAVLVRLGLETRIVPVAAIRENDQASAASQEFSVPSLATGISRFLVFSGRPPFVGSMFSTWGFAIVCRLIGALLSIPAWQWFLGSWFAWHWGSVLIAVFFGWFSDLFLLWFGGRLVLPDAKIPCARIEAALSPVSFVEAVPLVGVVAAPLWRIALRIQGISDATGVSAGRASMVILVPWMGASMLVGMLLLAFKFMV